MTNGYGAYNEIGISTSNPLKIVLMLYDGAISSLNKAIEHTEAGDIMQKNLCANNAREIVEELNQSLDLEEGGDMALNLRRLYFFMSRRIMKANWDNDSQGFSEVIELLTQLQGAWQDVQAQMASAGQQQAAARQSAGIRI